MKKNKAFKMLMLGTLCSIPLMMSGCAAVVVGAAATGTGVVVGSDSRTVDSMLYDETIEQNAYKIFTADENLSKRDNFAVSVVSMSGNVLLVGQTTNSAYFNECVEKIKHLDYVRKVYNFVTIRKPLGAGVTAKDALLTSMIKTKLLFGENIKSGRFKVVTEDSIVYLLGYVTQDEAKRAVNEVQKFDGVKKIYTIFDYMENVPVQHRSSNPPIIDKTQVSNNAGTTIEYSSAQQPQNISSQALEVVPQASQSQTVVSPDNGGAVIIDDTSLPDVY